METQQERSYELRSEKVRSIVGQVPPSITRYGIVVIALVLACLFAVAYFLPYRQVYSGTAFVGEQAAASVSDSVELRILLRFEGKQLSGHMHQPITFSLPDGQLEGQILQIAPQRDTLERHEALCQLATNDIPRLEGQALDFRLTLSSGNILSRMLGQWFSMP